jgi:peptidyl-prolyl cis-trans isomerase A (cyclophilin A)/peptidyl-prolyl cis-trans isomerase B (cyclophilin B)
LLLSLNLGACKKFFYLIFFLKNLTILLKLFIKVDTMFEKIKLKDYKISAEESLKQQYAKVSTEKGDIWLKLFPDEAPNTVANFAYLGNSGFYDNLSFHRVIPGFMAQGGCPDGTGMGGPGWAIACETDTNTSVHRPGTLSMAHAGKDTGGSQFFITFADTPHLDGVHTIFGAIEKEDAESFKVLKTIQGQDAIKNISVVQSR